MKKLYYVIPFLAIILPLWSFDVFDGIDNRDVSEGSIINSYFPFEFYVSHLETMYWKSFSDMKLEIDNDHQVDDSKFHVSYSLNGKEGKMYMGDEEITFDVKSIDIELTLDYASELDKEVYYTKKSDLKFGLNPVFEYPNKVKYTAKAVIKDATGVIEVGSNRYTNGETFDIEVGNLDIGFIPTVEDYKNTNAKVGLLITDNYGNSEEIVLPIKVNIGYF